MDRAPAAAIDSGEDQTQVDVMAAGMSPARTCITACADVHQSLRNVQSCISQRCNWNDVTAAASMNLAKRWKYRLPGTARPSWPGCGLDWQSAGATESAWRRTVVAGRETSSDTSHADWNTARNHQCQHRNDRIEHMKLILLVFYYTCIIMCVE